MPEFARRVEVTFLLPGFGTHREVYDVLDVGDRACWRANCQSYPQISMVEVETVQIPVARLPAWHRLLRQRGAAARKLGLHLRIASASTPRNATATRERP